MRAVERTRSRLKTPEHIHFITFKVIVDTANYEWIRRLSASYFLYCMQGGRGWESEAISMLETVQVKALSTTSI